MPWPLAYGLATPLHHHALCDTCGALTDVTAATLAATLAAAQAATGYVLTLTGLTLPGCCPACQQASPDACPCLAGDGSGRHRVRHHRREDAAQLPVGGHRGDGQSQRVCNYRHRSLKVSAKQVIKSRDPRLPCTSPSHADRTTPATRISVPRLWQSWVKREPPGTGTDP